MLVHTLWSVCGRVSTDAIELVDDVIVIDKSICVKARCARVCEVKALIVPILRKNFTQALQRLPMQ